MEGVGQLGGGSSGRPVSLAAAQFDGSSDVLYGDANFARDGVADGADVRHDQLTKVAPSTMLPTPSSPLMMSQSCSSEKLASADFSLSVQEVAHEKLVSVDVV